MLIFALLSLLGQKFSVRFLGELKKSKSPFEINWPLENNDSSKLVILLVENPKGMHCQSSKKKRVVQPPNCLMTFQSNLIWVSPGSATGSQLLFLHVLTQFSSQLGTILWLEYSLACLHKDPNTCTSCSWPNKYSSPPQLRYPQLRYICSYAILNWVQKNSS